MMLINPLPYQPLSKRSSLFIRCTFCHLNLCATLLVYLCVIVYVTAYDSFIDASLCVLSTTGHLHQGSWLVLTQEP